jgi:hypothetical protein
MTAPTSFETQLIEAWKRVTAELGDEHEHSTYMSALMIELESLYYIAYLRHETKIMYKGQRVGTVMPDLTVEHDDEVSVVTIRSDLADNALQIRRLRGVAQGVDRCNKGYVLHIAEEIMTIVNAHNAGSSYRVY